jgi:hypothetical protein
MAEQLPEQKENLLFFISFGFLRISLEHLKHGISILVINDAPLHFLLQKLAF